MASEFERHVVPGVDGGADATVGELACWKEAVLGYVSDSIVGGG